MKLIDELKSKDFSVLNLIKVYKFKDLVKAINNIVMNTNEYNQLNSNDLYRFKFFQLLSYIFISKNLHQNTKKSLYEKTVLDKISALEDVKQYCPIS